MPLKVPLKAVGKNQSMHVPKQSTGNEWRLLCEGSFWKRWQAIDVHTVTPAILFHRPFQLLNVSSVLTAAIFIQFWQTPIMTLSLPLDGKSRDPNTPLPVCQRVKERPQTTSSLRHRLVTGHCKCQASAVRLGNTVSPHYCHRASGKAGHKSIFTSHYKKPTS